MIFYQKHYGYMIMKYFLNGYNIATFFVDDNSGPLKGGGKKRKRLAFSKL